MGLEAVRFPPPALRPSTCRLIMRRGTVDGRGLAPATLALGHALMEDRNLALEPVDQLPLGRDGGIQLINGLVLMGDANFQRVEAV